MSGVTCKHFFSLIFLFFKFHFSSDKKVGLFCGGSVINGPTPSGLVPCGSAPQSVYAGS